MYLHALITLSVIGSILAIGNLGYILWQKRKYNIANQQKKQNVKGNKAKSMREINNQVKSNFIKTILNTKMMQVLLIFDGCFFYDNFSFNCRFCLNLDPSNSCRTKKESDK